MAKCFRCRGAISYVLLDRYPVTTVTDDVVMILDLPAQRCTQCRQLFFSTAVAETLDALRRGEIAAPRRRLIMPAYKIPTQLREAAKTQPVTQEDQAAAPAEEG